MAAGDKVVSYTDQIIADLHTTVAALSDVVDSMATALESYYIDFGQYPPSTLGSAPDSISRGNPLLATMPTFSLNNSFTTPIAYMTGLMEDTFNEGPPDTVNTFSYFSDGNGWILVSPGPDRDFDIDPPRDYDSSIEQPSPSLIAHRFDPTNGTVSDGDIYRLRY